MTKLEVVKQELERNGVFDVHENAHMKMLTEVLGEDVPISMARVMSNFMMSSFIGHFHMKIKLAEDNIVPMNLIAFILAKSGVGKTSSLTKLEKALHGGFKVISAYRGQRALTLSQVNGTPMKPLNPLSNALATEAGMIKRLNDFAKEGIGVPYMFVDEISTELATNIDMVPNIKIIAQLFDDGDMKSKPLKDSENQSEEVKGMGMCGMFIGSEAGILEDDDILKKFLLEFISKLARRSFFVYPEFFKRDFTMTSIQEILADLKVRNEHIESVREEIDMISQKLGVKLTKLEKPTIGLSDETRALYDTYKAYCEEMSELVAEEAVALETQHRHWKCLKLAGTYAAWKGHDNIEVDDLKEAIYMGEVAKEFLPKFIYKAQRQPFEIIVDHYLEDGPELKVHQVVKKKWIKKPVEVHDLITFANSKMGSEGTLKLEGDTIILERFKPIEGHGVSYLPVTGTKEERASACSVGYTYDRVEFKDLAQVLSNDVAYCAWEFEGGKRGKDYVTGTATFIVMDVDYSDDTDSEVSNMLADYNHIVCRTSDKENPYKFRIILESDIEIDCSIAEYKMLLEKIGEDLGLTVDILSKAQIFFGYADREPLINMEVDKYPVSQMIKRLDKVGIIERKDLSTLFTMAVMLK